MHFMLTIVHGLVILTVCQVVTSRPSTGVKEYAIEKCRERGKDIYEVKDQQWCCNCPAGFHKEEDCSFGYPNTTVCKPCVFDPGDTSKQTYMAVENNSTNCFKLDNPNENDCPHMKNAQLAIVSPGRAPRCQCISGYFLNQELQTSECRKHRICGPGLYPSQLGNSIANTKCEGCLNGTFSNLSSTTSLCVKHTKCKDGETVLIEGTSMRDVVCSKSNLVTQDWETTVPYTFVKAENSRVEPTEDTGSGTTLIIVICSTVFVLAMVVIVGAVVYKRKNGTQNKSPDPEAHSVSHTDPSVGCASTENADEIGEASGLLSNGRSDDPTIPTNEDTQVAVRECYEHTCSEEHVEINEGENIEIESYHPPRVRCQMKLDKDPLDAATPENSTDANEIQMINENSITENKLEIQEAPATNRETLEDEIIRRIKEKLNVNISEDVIPRWKEEIERKLKDTDMSWKMLKSLRKHTFADLRRYMREFLEDGEIDDEEKNHHREVKEIKYRWLLACKNNHGRKLTPEFLLNIQYQQKIFRDEMMDVFVAEFSLRLD